MNSRMGFCMNIYDNTNELSSKKAKLTGYINNMSYDFDKNKVITLYRSKQLSFVKRKQFRESLLVPTNTTKVNMKLPYYTDIIKNQNHIGYINNKGNICHNGCKKGIKRNIVGEPILDRWGKHTKIKTWKKDQNTKTLIDTPYWTDVNKYCLELEEQARTTNMPHPLYSRIFSQTTLKDAANNIKKNSRKYEIEAFVIAFMDKDNKQIERLEYFNGKIKMNISNIQPFNNNQTIIKWQNR